MRPQTYRLTYDSMIALLQGKELHVHEDGNHFIFKPPFGGVFITHEQFSQLRHNDILGVLEQLKGIAEHTN